MTSADLDEGLEAFVFGVQVFVEVDGLVVAAAELPVNLLHALGAAARKLRGRGQNIQIGGCKDSGGNLEITILGVMERASQNHNILTGFSSYFFFSALTWLTRMSPMLQMRKLLLFFCLSATDALFLSSSVVRRCVCMSTRSSRTGKICGM